VAVTDAVSVLRQVTPPSGVVTFLFTDVEGSTKLWEQKPAEMRVALATHDEILRSAIASADGLVFSTAGDAFAAAFQAPADAISAAAAAQRDLDRHDWPGGASIRVRMGLHTGIAHQRDDDYFGPTLNRAARLMSAAHGGQIVISTATQELLTDAALVDMGEHRLKDLSRPERVWQLIVEGLTREFPPLRTLNAVPTNLPTDLATFIGREDDIAQVMTDLEQHRLVVMTGVGGVGKTRLSLQVAAEASHHYPQGLWFVELAPVPLDDAVQYKFLETLGLEAEPGQRPLQTVAAAIGKGTTLLIIDNCEHVPGAAATTIRELLNLCPNLKVLASSRRSLGVAGEQVRRIQPLGTTGHDSAATRLFLDRAGSAGQSILTESDDVIADICTRLDGVPLAIELAAARTRSMTPGDIAARLDERFRLLKGARSGGNERHQTLMSTIAWSYQLLNDPQKLLFQRLSVFAGAFTLSAAERICADEDLDEFDILDLVDELVDQSLLVADTGGNSTRYRMLETIREYARQEVGDGMLALRDRHASYHAAWVDQIFARLLTIDEPVALAELELGWSDLRTAAAHSTGNLDLLATILAPLAYDGMFRSRLELADWATTALSVADAGGASDETRSVLLATGAGLSGLAGSAEQATAFATELCELCERTGLPITAEVSGTAIGGVLLSGGLELIGRIQDLSERSVQPSTPPWAVVMIATFRAIVATYSGQPDVAKAATARAMSAMPADFSPSFSALACWMTAMHSDAPRTEVVTQMERVVAQASLVRSTFLQAIFRQYLSSVRGELGDLRQPMSEAADNLEGILSNHQIGLATGTIRRAAVLLIKAGFGEVAAILLGWVDSTGHPIPPTADLAAEMDVLLPKLRQELGATYETAMAAGPALSPEAAIKLGIATLREGIDQLG
jgi:predicted ATPase/class 3 adenylate cyclase